MFRLRGLSQIFNNTNDRNGLAAAIHKESLRNMSICAESKQRASEPVPVLAMTAPAPPVVVGTDMIKDDYKLAVDIHRAAQETRYSPRAAFYDPTTDETCILELDNWSDDSMAVNTAAMDARSDVTDEEMDSAAQETMRETIIKTGKLERVNAISQRFDFDAAEIIATGAFGQIMSPKENREIVIKTARRVQDASNKTPDELRLAQIDYKEGQRALVNESVFTMLCAHPHIACFKRVINDFGADELYCVMDRLDMRLDDYLLSKTIHGNGHPHHLRRNKRKICMDLARGVHYLHAHMHIIHRDLKHNNVMLWFGANGMPTAVIIDLGLAVKMDALKRTDRLSLNKYTVMYRPPELVWGDRSYSFAADIWALACMFWEIYHVPDSMFARKSVIEQYLFYLPKDDVMCLAQLHATHLGAPDIRQWPEVVNLRHYAPIMAVFSEFDFTGVRNPRVDDIAQLFAGMLQYNPARRPDAARVCASLEATYAEEKFVSV